MSEEDERDAKRWSGCGCEQCTLVTTAMLQIEEHLDVAIELLEGMGHHGALLHSVLDSFSDVMDSLEEDTLRGMLRAKHSAMMVADYISIQVREEQVRRLVEREIGALAKGLVVIATADKSRPPWTPPSRGGDGSGGFGPH